VRARLSLYDVAGRRVATLIDGAFAPGTQRVPLERVDTARRAIRAGLTFRVRVKTRLLVAGR